MSEHREPFDSDEPMDRRLQELPDIPADDDFRARLKSAFVEGSFHEAPKRKARPLYRWRWTAMPLAACLMILAVLAMNRGPRLTVMETAWQGAVEVDGETIPVGDAARLERALQSGVRLKVPADGALDLAMGQTMLLEVAGGTEMTLPSSPGRWYGRAVACSVMVGEVRVLTGRAFAGSTLWASTPDGIVRLTGTLLSIQCDAGGTCVCVLEGTAYVGTDEADLEPVQPGFRKIMLKDGTVEIVPVKPMHRDGVLDFESRAGKAIMR